MALTRKDERVLERILRLRNKEEVPDYALFKDFVRGAAELEGADDPEYVAKHALTKVVTRMRIGVTLGAPEPVT
jgi:hypothetical protein